MRSQISQPMADGEEEKEEGVFKYYSTVGGGFKKTKTIRMPYNSVSDIVSACSQVRKKKTRKTKSLRRIKQRADGELFHKLLENTERFLFPVSQTDFEKNKEYYSKCNTLIKLEYLQTEGQVRELDINSSRWNIQGRIDCLRLDHEKKVISVIEMKTHLGSKPNMALAHIDQVMAYVMVLGDMIFGQPVTKLYDPRERIKGKATKEQKDEIEQKAPAAEDINI